MYGKHPTNMADLWEHCRKSKYKWGAFFEVAFKKNMYGNHPTIMVEIWEHYRKHKIQMSQIGNFIPVISTLYLWNVSPGKNVNNK